LTSAPHDKEFVFHDGSRAKNLLELVSEIEHITDHEFHQFVNHSKNDFSNWIEHVLNDKHFADKLRTLLSRNETIRLIRDRIEETTVGNSIIKIPRIENHSEHHVESLEEHPIKHHEEQREEHNIKHEENYHEHREENHNKRHEKDKEEHHEKHVPDHLPDYLASTEKEKNRKREELDEESEEKLEKSEELKTKRHWFQLFSKKGLSEKKLEKIELKREAKLITERELAEELEQDNRENALWVILYFALVLLIITLLVYKLFI
jgi:hypothetical protein